MPALQVSPEKNLALLRPLLERVPGARLAVVGDGPAMEVRAAQGPPVPPWGGCTQRSRAGAACSPGSGACRLRRELVCQKGEAAGWCGAGSDTGRHVVRALSGAESLSLSGACAAACPGIVNAPLTPAPCTPPPKQEVKARLAGTRTTFLGRLSGRELSAAYASADIFVMPSESETLGNVVGEVGAG